MGSDNPAREIEVAPRGLFGKIRIWCEMIKFSHTVFALPFALSMYVVTARQVPVSLLQLAWILAALVSARSAAMAFNRILDRHIDGRNPRTRQREIPRGAVSVGSAWLFFSVATALFLFSAEMLGRHCLVLAPVVLLVLLGYSVTKRFTEGAHLVLGLALALAPGGVWYALTSQFAWLPVLMMCGVLAWVAGFDVLYSCQDCDFDRAEGLRSIPARFGVKRALIIARMLHAVSFAFLAAFAAAAGLGVWHFMGLGIFGFFLFSQHLLVSAHSLERIDAAFFTRNGLASLIYFLGTVIDTWN